MRRIWTRGILGEAAALAAAYDACAGRGAARPDMAPEALAAAEALAARWAAAPAQARDAAACLVVACRPAWATGGRVEAAGRPLPHAPLPVGDAAAVLAAREDWLGMLAEMGDAADAAAHSVLGRLGAAGHDVSGLSAADVVAAWLVPDRAAAQRAEEICAAFAARRGRLLPCHDGARRAVAEWARREALGWMLPAEVRAAMGGLDADAFARRVGVEAVVVAGWLSGALRLDAEQARRVSAVARGEDAAAPPRTRASLGSLGAFRAAVHGRA